MSIAIVDEDLLVANRLKVLLSAEPDMEVVGMAERLRALASGRR